MRRSTAILLVLLLVLGVFVLIPATVSADNTGTEFCKFLQAEFPVAFDANFKNLGDCVSDLQNLVNGNDGAAAFCKAEFFNTGYAWWEVLGFKNNGKCVSFFAHL